MVLNVHDFHFPDWNRRIGSRVMFFFLALNGIKPYYSQAEPVSLIREASKGEASRPEIFRWINDQEKDLF